VWLWPDVAGHYRNAEVHSAGEGEECRGPARIATEEWNKKADDDVGAEREGYSQWVEELWDVGKVPHIGIEREKG